MKDKYFKMDTMYKMILPALIMIAAVACGGGAADSKDGGGKKAELEKLKAEQQKINERVRALEEDLAKTDTTVANQLNTKLVVVTPVNAKPFSHFIELQGRIEAENMAYVTPRGMGGQVKSVHVRQGDRVKKGQLLLKLDNAVAEQQVQQAKIQLDLAEDLYKRRKNLWDKQIGTEVELIQARTNVENLKKGVALAEEQYGMSNVYAEISGVADMVNIKVGETFTAATSSMVGIRIVNTENLKVTTQVPENYLSQVKVGSIVQVILPDVGDTVTASVNVKGSTVDPSSRSFYIEARITGKNDFRANQLALVKIQDYSAANAVTIPMNTLQNDEAGKFVMVAARENGRLIAKKRPIQVGALYGNDLEVKSGLEVNDALITEGFQGLYDGQPVTTGDNS